MCWRIFHCVISHIFFWTFQLGGVQNVYRCLMYHLWGKEFSLNSKHRSKTPRVNSTENASVLWRNTDSQWACVNVSMWGCMILPLGTYGGWHWKHMLTSKGMQMIHHTQIHTDMLPSQHSQLPYMLYRCTQPKHIYPCWDKVQQMCVCIDCAVCKLVLGMWVSQIKAVDADPIAMH